MINLVGIYWRDFLLKRKCCKFIKIVERKVANLLRKITKRKCCKSIKITENLVFTFSKRYDTLNIEKGTTVVGGLPQLRSFKKEIAILAGGDFFFNVYLSFLMHIPKIVTNANRQDAIMFSVVKTLPSIAFTVSNTCNTILTTSSKVSNIMYFPFHCIFHIQTSFQNGSVCNILY